mmetsp:Transcript_14060/g.35809  ORF Transcript_14060/g.35809 Transcript_14060/m.35809 type:complete len:280 (+) Transcript_14060:1110-1949(+)
MLVARRTQQRQIARVAVGILFIVHHAKSRPISEQHAKPLGEARVPLRVPKPQESTGRAFDALRANPAGGVGGGREEERVFRLDVAVGSAVLSQCSQWLQHLEGERDEVRLGPARRHAALHQFEKRESGGEHDVHAVLGGSYRRGLIHVLYARPPTRCRQLRRAVPARHQQPLHLPRVEWQRHAPGRARVCCEVVAHPLEVRQLNPNALAVAPDRDGDESSTAQAVRHVKRSPALRVVYVLGRAAARHLPLGRFTVLRDHIRARPPRRPRGAVRTRRARS